MLSIDDIKKTDASDMFSILKAFPEQMEKAVEIAEKFKGFTGKKPSSIDLVVVGMGGSAMGGDVLKDYLAFSGIKNKIKTFVSRGYDLPHFIDDKTYVICSSFSGNTEETLEAAEKALKITSKIICITSGGKLLDFANENKLPFIQIPGGMQPRCALGYSVISMIYAVINSGMLTKAEAKKAVEHIKNTIETVKVLAENFTKYEEPNIAVTIAEMIKDSMTIVYSSEKFYAANLRFRCQIQENCKSLAFGNMIPEMNHNEINAFDNPADVVNKTTVVIFNDETDHPRVKLRIEKLKNIIDDNIATIIELTAASDEYLTKLFEYIYLGDWVSYYAAIMRNADPTPIPVISKFKKLIDDANKEKK